MKITKDMVGKKVRRESWEIDSYLEIKFVGEKKFFASEKNGNEGSWLNEDPDNYPWEFYEAPKSKRIVRMAPALSKNYAGNWLITFEVYSSREEATKKNPADQENLKWPANDNMWVEIEVEE